MKQREIKFRAWWKEAKMMVDIKSWRPESIEFFVPVASGSKEWDELQVLDEPSQYELMQYTGLKDKNDVEIYEGDIVTQEYLVNKGMQKEQVLLQVKGVVVFIGARYYIEGKVTIDGEEKYGANTLGGRHRRDDEVLDVIGNIYEHSHLLEK